MTLRRPPLSLLLLAGCIDATYDEGKALFPDSASSSGASTSTTTTSDEPTGGIHTVTGPEPSSSTGTTSSGATTGTTSGPALPMVTDVKFTPDPLEAAGTIAVDVATVHATGLQMQLEDGATFELTAAPAGHFLGTIEVLSGLAEAGTHTATFTPRQGDLVGEPFVGEYTLSLPPAGSEVVWDVTPDFGKGQVDALALAPAGDVLALGTLFDGNNSTCFVHRRGLDGKPTADTAMLFPNYRCLAEDLVAGDGDEFWVLVSLETGGTWRWRLASLAWGQDPVVLRTGAQDEVGRALARSPLGDLAVCGSGPSSLPVFDKIDGRIWRVIGASTEIDYRPELGKTHTFDEMIQDCAFANEELRLVGEVYGPHDGKLKPWYKRPFLATGGGSVLVAPETTLQGGATSLAVTPDGETLMGLYTCGDPCNQQGELRKYDLSGEIAWRIPLQTDVVPPVAVAWSPAGYVVMASAEAVDVQSSAFLLQAFAPPKPQPVWQYEKMVAPGLNIALALALAPSVVVGGGLDSGGFWALAFVAP